MSAGEAAVERVARALAKVDGYTFAGVSEKGHEVYRAHAHAALAAAAPAPGDALATAIEDVLIGGNHLVSIIGGDHPQAEASADEALAHYGAGTAYDAWVAWRAIMILSRLWAASRRAQGAGA